MVVHADRMLENLEASHGLVFSESVMLALVASGLPRDDAYRMVQRAATRTWEEGRPFRDVLAADAEIAEHLDPAAIDACFDLEHAVAHAARAVDALEQPAASR
jgi:adenylosuccinate lyase